MQSRSRPLRTAVAALLPACLLLAACKADPKTHSNFTAYSNTPDAAPMPDATTPMPDTAPPPPSDGGTSTGCGMEPQQVSGSYVEYHMNVAGPDLDGNNQPKVRDRKYYVRLPASYDPSISYRVIYIGPGCGGSTDKSVLNLFTVTGEDAILVAVMPLNEFGQCFDETMASVEYPFFDALHKQIEASFCVDTNRQFYAGFSTGARLAYMLDCAFPDVLRAVGAIQGAQPPLPTCKKDPIGLFVIADTMETGNPYMANVMATSRLFTQNACEGTFISPMPPAGCGAACTTYDTMATNAAPPTTTCVKYKGCPADGPIVFCSTIGQGHQTFEPWSDQALWNFFKAF